MDDDDPEKANDVGPFSIKCPHCSREYETRNSGKIRCFVCHTWFVIDREGEFVTDQPFWANCPDCGNAVWMEGPYEEAICPVCYYVFYLPGNLVKVHCLLCKHEFESPTAGPVSCPICSWTFMVDVYGRTEERAPIWTQCPECLEQVIVAKPGRKTCPECSHEFRINKYGNITRRDLDQDPLWDIAFSYTNSVVKVKADRPVRELVVWVPGISASFRVALADWEKWLSGGCFDACGNETERKALNLALRWLEDRVPTSEAVVAWIASSDASNPYRFHERACENLAYRSATSGISCPVCKQFSTDFMYYREYRDSWPDLQSRLICQRCGTEFGPTDV